jgi:hypothetical protein
VRPIDARVLHAVVADDSTRREGHMDITSASQRAHDRMDPSGPHRSPDCTRGPPSRAWELPPSIRPVQVRCCHQHQLSTIPRYQKNFIGSARAPLAPTNSSACPSQHQTFTHSPERHRCRPNQQTGSGQCVGWRILACPSGKIIRQHWPSRARTTSA